MQVISLKSGWIKTKNGEGGGGGAVKITIWMNGTKSYQAFYGLKYNNIMETGSFKELNQRTSCFMLQFNPITYGGGLFGPDHQIIDHNSKTAPSGTSKLGDF